MFVFLQSISPKNSVPSHPPGSSTVPLARDGCSGEARGGSDVGANLGGCFGAAGEKARLFMVVQRATLRVDE